MRNSFVYIIGWRQADVWYCGVRYRAGCETSDLWTLYYTSSKSVANFRRLHGEPDVIRVLRVFGENTSEARLYEQKFLQKVKAISSNRWLNKAVGGHFAGRRGPHSEETKRKISAKAKGRKLSPVSEERKQRQRKTFMKNYDANREERFIARSAKQKGRIVTEEHRAKISATLTGTKISEETKLKISNASKNQSKESRERQATKLRKMKWFTDGQKVVRAETCPIGFHPGRIRRTIPSRRRAEERRPQ